MAVENQEKKPAERADTIKADHLPRENRWKNGKDLVTALAI